MWRRYSLVAGWMVVVAGWLVVAGALLLRIPTTGSDFAVYLAAAQALRFAPHANIYQWHIIVAAQQAHGGCQPWGLPYLYQPLLALLLEPLAAMPCTAAWSVWQTLNLALWAACAAALARYAYRPNPRGSTHPWLALLVTALTLSFLPIIQGLVIGEIHVIILAICLGGAALVRRERPALTYLAGALLGFGVVIKYFPLILILYFVLRGRWRVAVGAAVAGAALVAGELLVVGPHTLIESVVGIHYAATVESQGAATGNLALAALAGLAFVVGVLWTGRVRARGTADDERQDEAMGVAWALATILVVSPLLQWPYLTWLLPAFAICLSMVLGAWRTATGWRRWWPLALVIVAYGLMMLRMWFIRYPDPAAPIAVTSTIGAVLVWGLCGAYYLRGGASARTRASTTLSALTPQEATPPISVR